MKGFKIIGHFKEIKINRAIRKRNEIKKVSRSNISKLKSEGYFNGNLLACYDFKKENNILFLNCNDLSFFEFMSNRTKEELPKLVNVNALLEINNKILLIKRDSKVYSYKNFWDFPAGLIHFKENLIEKLFDRIKTDTGIERKYLNLKKGVLFGQSRRYASLFYNVSLKTKGKYLDKIIKNSKGKIKLFEKNEILKLAKNNKLVYPEVLV